MKEVCQVWRGINFSLKWVWALINMGKAPRMLAKKPFGCRAPRVHAQFG